MSWFGFKPYVPVAKRRAQAEKCAAKIAKKENRTLAPVRIEGKGIAKTFWGRAWCDNLERFSDFANRLPRGRTYARNGSVIDLQIEQGLVKALVSGSEVYRIEIRIKTIGDSAWRKIKDDCAKSVDSLMDLLQGKFSDATMTRLTRPKDGLFPAPQDIEMKCSCPDWATMCKHVAAVLYGVGARLDSQPELLFLLRGVDHADLIREAATAENLNHALGGGQNDALGGSDLSELFGIEIDANAVLNPSESKSQSRSKAKPKAATRPSPLAAKPAEPTKPAASTRSKPAPVPIPVPQPQPKPQLKTQPQPQSKTPSKLGPKRTAPTPMPTPAKPAPPPAPAPIAAKPRRGRPPKAAQTAAAPPASLKSNPIIAPPPTSAPAPAVTAKPKRGRPPKTAKPAAVLSPAPAPPLPQPQPQTRTKPKTASVVGNAPIPAVPAPPPSPVRKKAVAAKTKAKGSRK